MPDTTVLVIRAQLVYTWLVWQKFVIIGIITAMSPKILSRKTFGWRRVSRDFRGVGAAGETGAKGVVAAGWVAGSRAGRSAGPEGNL